MSFALQIGIRAILILGMLLPQVPFSDNSVWLPSLTNGASSNPQQPAPVAERDDVHDTDEQGDVFDDDANEPELPEPSAPASNGDDAAGVHAANSDTRTFPILPEQAAEIAHDNVRLNIQVGAVTEPLSIMVTPLSEGQLPPLDQGMVNVTQGPRRGYRFLPHMRFQNQLTIHMKYDPRLLPPGMSEQNIHTFYFDEELGSWIPLERVEVDTQNQVISSLTDHFTDMINAVVMVPDHPETQSHTPNSLQDIQAANPGAGINLVAAPGPNSQGDASLSYPISLPPGRAGMAPTLSINYSSGAGNGWLGTGWDLTLPTITVDTRWGVPRYDAAFETESYLLNGEQLTPLAHREPGQPRTSNKQFHQRVEQNFLRIMRHGNSPQDYWWEVTDKNGVTYVYGGTPDSVLTDQSPNGSSNSGNIYQWLLREMVDANGNGVAYEYDLAIDSGLGNGTTGNPGAQVYPRSVNYTQSNGTEGLYTVTFVRDSQLSGYVRRPDVMIDARGGFKMVTAELLKQIIVTYDGHLVRQYDLDYITGAFHKTLLLTVTQRGEDGTVFHTHTFEYYNEVGGAAGTYVGFAETESWEVPFDNVSAGLLGFGDATALGGALSNSLGGHLYLGFNATTPSKQLSIGVKVGAVDSDTETVLAMIDLDGDGLPDKVFKIGNDIFYRMQVASPDGNYFDEKVQIATLPVLSKESSTTYSFGPEAYYGIGALFNTAETFSTSSAYFNDVNGDGLMDMVIGGRVYFNHLGTTPDGRPLPIFTLDDSSQTPVPIAAGVVDTANVVDDYSDLYEEAIDRFPLHDTLRRWVAPFDGTVYIEGDVALIEDTSDARGQYDQADGVRVAIEKNGAELLWARDIGPDDYATKTPTRPENGEEVEGLIVPVQKGDRIYFRVQSVFNGAYDQVVWTPQITYTDLPERTDANGLLQTHYDAAGDFVLAGRRDIFVQVPMTGTLRLAGDLHKLAQTSDDIELQVYQNGVINFTETLTWNQVGAIDLNLDISVVPQDTIQLRVKVDSPIDVRQIEWTPELYYIEAPQAGTIVDDLGNPLFQLHPPYDIDLYPASNLDAPQQAWTATTTGQVDVRAQITAAPEAIGTVVFTVKKAGARLAKQTIPVAVGGGNATLNLHVQAGDQLFFDLSVYDPQFAAQLSGASVTVDPTPDGNPVDAIPAPSALRWAELPNVWPQPYRGWAVAGYNGNRDFATQLIDESRLHHNFSDIVDGAGNPESPYDTNTATVYLFNPVPAEGRWQGPDYLTWVSATAMSSSRLGPNAIDVPQPGDFAGQRAVTRLSRTSQQAIQISAGTNIGPIPVSGSGSVSGYDPLRGESYAEVDFQDMNGDGFPDVLGKGGIQYSTPDGGLHPHSEEVPGYGLVREVEARSRNFGLGGSPTFFRSSSKGEVHTPGASSPGENSVTTQMISLGGGLAGTLGDGESTSTSELRDMNGDGLPDRVRVVNGQLQVALNLGYSFAPPEIWGPGAIHQGSNVNAVASANLGVLGYNDGIYGFAGGFSLNRNASTTSRTLIDVNGDGLVDQVRWDDGQLLVSFNLGGAFAQEVIWSGTPFDALAADHSTGYGGGLYFTIGIGPLCVFFSCYVIINPGVDGGQNMGRPRIELRDVDGDGLVDHVFSERDDELVVARNQTGRTNLLRRVNRPLGAVIDLEYARAGNTYDMPQSKWVLSSVRVTDGHAGDGVDQQVSSFVYEEGKHDRYERQFYGFGQVIEQHHQPGGAVYRRIVSEYHTDSYYTKGLLRKQTMFDAAGNKFEETEHTYVLRDILTQAEPADASSGTAALFPQLRRTDQRAYEGQPTAGMSAHTEMAYDAYGNMSHYLKAGGPGAEDDLQAVIHYTGEHAACQANHIVGSAYHIEVKDGAGNVLQRREAVVDCETGNVTQMRAHHLESGQVAVTDMAYFANGNLQSVTGPDNYKGVGERFALSFDYDVETQTHVTQVSDSFGYSSQMAYNLKYGLPTLNTDINGSAIAHTYDVYGRVTTVTGPHQTGGAPTIVFEYHPHASVPWAMTRHLDEYRDAADTIDTVVFIDGLQRVVQTKKDATIYTGTDAHIDSPPQDVMIVSGRVEYDFAGRQVASYYPVVEPKGTPGTFNPSVDTDAPPTTVEYDILDRATKTVMPDATTVQMSYGFGADLDGAPRYATISIDPNGNMQKVLRDHRQAIVAHIAYNQGQEIWSRYVYDPLQRMVAHLDDHGNTTQIVYDSLDRRTVLDSPDGGRIEFVYDLANNLIAKVTPNLRADNQQIEYTYDFTRLTEILYPDFPDNNVTYTYGEPGAAHYRAGRITLITDQSGQEEYFYGPLGEVVTTIRMIASDTPDHTPETYTTDYVYDTWNRLQRMTYPDGEVLTYRYDAGGRVHQVTGVKGDFTYAYLHRMEYDKFGMRAFVETGNNVRTTYRYDPANRYLVQLQAGKGEGNPFQNLLYEYDDVGNVTGVINDVVAQGGKALGGRVAQSYAYDDLYRLTQAAGTFTTATGKRDEYTLVMAYDTIHNITNKHQAHSIVQPSGTRVVQQKTSYEWTYTYDSNTVPHGVREVGERTYHYDANGNQVGWTHDVNATQRQIVYDEENRIQSISDNGHVQRYKYDASGERVIKRGPQGEAVYVNQYFSIRNGEIGTKHVFVGDTRLVSKLMKQDKPGGNPNGKPPQEKDLYYFHPDHLGGAQYVTDASGQIYQHIQYFPFGETWVEEASTTHRTPYLFTGKELDEETGLYYYGARYYDPRTSVFLSTDPLIMERPEEMTSRPMLANTYAYALQNPVKFVDPDGRNPVQRMVVPIRQGGDQAQAALVIDIPVQHITSPRYLATREGGINLNARMTLVTQQGDQWVAAGKTADVTLKFTASDDIIHSLPGTEFKRQWTPQTVRAIATCAVNNCLVTKRASGGKYKHFEVQAMLGKFELVNKDGVTLDLNQLGGADANVPFYFHGETGMSDMPAQWGIAPGIGYTSTGADPKSFNRIVTGPTIGSLKEGPSILKAEHPKH